MLPSFYLEYLFKRNWQKIQTLNIPPRSIYPWEEGNRNDKDYFIETQIQEVSTISTTLSIKTCAYVRRSTRHVLSIVDIEGKFAFILKPFRRMLLRFWKASLGPTQAGRRGCWHLYPPQPGLGWAGLSGLTSDYGWQFFRFSAAGSKPQSAAAACRAIYQRRTMAANPPQYFARPFTARPRFAARGRAAADCARLLYSLFCGNLKPGSRQHTTLQHSLCRVCPFIDVTTWSQQAPWESGIFSFLFSLPSFIVSII